jgi:hypothetical protein
MQMKQYIGTKIINARPINRLDYNTLRGWVLPQDENGTDEGYLVEYSDGGKPNTTLFAGYISWSPKEQFENAYIEVEGLSFGKAIDAIKLGARVQREGWNGKDMWIAYSPGSPSLAADAFWSPANKEYAISLGGLAPILPCITFKTATGEILMGWLASQSDMLANDWRIL